MQEITIRKLSQALELISDYRNQNIGLRYLVDSLEGIILSLEEQLPQDFFDKWYEDWSELEIILALEQENLDKDKIEANLKNLETALLQFIEAR
jgi:hypothetical protein